MRVENKIYYYFEEKEKGLFTDFLWESRNSMGDFAEMCGISIAYLSLIVNGKRAISEELLKEFEKNGFTLEIKDTNND